MVPDLNNLGGPTAMCPSLSAQRAGLWSQNLRYRGATHLVHPWNVVNRITPRRRDDFPLSGTRCGTGRLGAGGVDEPRVRVGQERQRLLRPGRRPPWPLTLCGTLAHLTAVSGIPSPGTMHTTPGGQRGSVHPDFPNLCADIIQGTRASLRPKPRRLQAGAPRARRRGTCGRCGTRRPTTTATTTTRWRWPAQGTPAGFEQVEG